LHLGNFLLKKKKKKKKKTKKGKFKVISFLLTLKRLLLIEKNNKNAKNTFLLDLYKEYF